eukprot:12090496-Alexandrium_andersonii.AAC.1
MHLYTRQAPHAREPYTNNNCIIHGTIAILVQDVLPSMSRSPIDLDSDEDRHGCDVYGPVAGARQGQHDRLIS